VRLWRTNVTDVLIIKLLREALMVLMIVSAPLLGVGMLVGLVISIFQTTTSIQEQTLTFVPKIVAIFVTFILLAAWIIHTLVNYTKNLFLMISKIGAG
jgi:flagellar biosynthetic protein FliQ